VPAVANATAATAGHADTMKALGLSRPRTKLPVTAGASAATTGYFPVRGGGEGGARRAVGGVAGHSALHSCTPTTGAASCLPLLHPPQCNSRQSLQGCQRCDASGSRCLECALGFVEVSPGKCAKCKVRVWGVVQGWGRAWMGQSVGGEESGRGRAGQRRRLLPAPHALT
jgi:hypothetical protein